MPDRILVVDDEEAIREIVCAILVAAGYTCKQAGLGLKRWLCWIPATNLN